MNGAMDANLTLLEVVQKSILIKIALVFGDLSSEFKLVFILHIFVIHLFCVCPCDLWPGRRLCAISLCEIFAGAECGKNVEKMWENVEKMWKYIKSVQTRPKMLYGWGSESLGSCSKIDLNRICIRIRNLSSETWVCFYTAHFVEFKESQVRLHRQMTLSHGCELDSPGS